MKIIDRIVEAEMTADEQVELTRLEDEVSQARDDVEFAEDSVKNARDHYGYTEARDEVYCNFLILEKTINNLNNYIDSITKKVMERITVTDV